MAEQISSTTDAAVDLQVLTSFPNFNNKHIDCVIAYEEISDEEPISKQNQKIKLKRKEFFDDLKRQSFELFDIENELENSRKIVFTLLHCPLERLLQEAENTRLEMRLKNVNRRDL